MRAKKDERAKSFGVSPAVLFRKKKQKNLCELWEVACNQREIALPYKSINSKEREKEKVQPMAIEKVEELIRAYGKEGDIRECTV